MKTLLLISIIILSSCNPCNQIAKKIAKNPQCYKTIERTVTIRDTITLSDTFIVPETRLQVITERDTIIETKRIYFEKRGSSYEVICKEDTLYRTDTIYRFHDVKVTEHNLKPVRFWNMWWFWLLVALFLLGLNWMSKRK
jgi:hypothetical protein